MNSKEYEEGYQEAKRNINKAGMGYINPYLNPRPQKEEYKKFVEWNKGYRAAIAEAETKLKVKVKPVAKKKAPKKKVAKKKSKAKK